MAKDNLDDYVTNFRHLCMKEFMRNIRVESMKQSNNEDVESIILRKGEELLEKVRGEIADYILPQQVKDALKFSSYARYVSNIENSITQREIFGDCIYCSRADFPEKSTDLYCSEFKINCIDIELTERIPCIKFDRLDVSKMDDVRRAIVELEDSGEERDLSIARNLLEKARVELSAKYKNLRTPGRILPH